MKKMKIAVRGPVGSGKTTLARAMASRFGVLMIEEDMKGIYSTHGRWKECRKNPNASKNETEIALKNAVQAFATWANRRTSLYAAQEGFVADRWEADLLDVWLKMFSDFGYDKVTASLFKDMRAKAKKLDYVVVMPLREPFEELKNESGLTRKKAFSLRLMSHALTGGLLQQCPGLTIIFIPNRPMTVEERVAHVEALITKRFAQL